MKGRGRPGRMVLAERSSHTTLGVGGGSGGHGQGSGGGHLRSGSGRGGASGQGAHLRSQSPTNGHGGSDSDSSGSDDEPEGNVMRVGNEFQAVVPDKATVRPLPAPASSRENAVLVWSPTNNISDHDLEEYCALAKDKYNYNMEQALGMLCWHKFHLNTAMSDLPNFTPFPDEWTVEDKVLFEQAFQFHDKHFHKIKQMLPDKSIASLVKYYYSWKKTRSRTSLMDRQARRLKEDQKDEGSEDETPAASDDEAGGADENKEVNGDSVMDAKDPTAKQRCENCCTTASGQFNQTTKGILCKACHSYWRRTGTMKNSSATKRHEPTRHNLNPSKAKRKPPRGMYCDIEDLSAIASGPQGHGEALLKALDSEIVNLKRQVQNNKQMISQTKHKIVTGIKDISAGDGPTRLSSRWTREDELIAVQAMRKFGKDFVAIAEVLGNKSEAHVKSFYASNERKYKLNELIKEAEAEAEDDDSETEAKRRRVDGAA